MKFTYNSGQRPLEGYTLKRGIGRGGFGEVYLGLSDGGKEVALKLVRGDLEVELRGISQCLNLKHPNLVHLYDLRTDAQGNHWVVMEYVAGDSLSAIIGKHPQGVAPELATEWFQGLSAAIHYLHGHGIVHRDLKPANIFLEQGMIKVGDYGLCKFIGGSQGAGQTQSVGTVHYMAPEISTGNYNRQIDVYSSGIILYEMLTGRVPFDGETAGEILMKHLTTPPDLSKVPPAFVPILDRALCKNPAHRFQSITDMSKQVTALFHKEAHPAKGTTRLTISGHDTETTTEGAKTAAARLAELGTALFLGAFLAGILAFVGTTLFDPGDWATLAKYFFLTLACSWAVMVPAYWWRRPADDSWVRRAVLMGLGLAIGVLGLWLEGYSFPSSLGDLPDAQIFKPAAAPAANGPRHPFFGALYSDNRSLPVAAGYLGFFGLLFLALRWWRMTELHRPQRFRAASMFAVAFWAFMLFFLLPGTAERQMGFVALLSAAAVVQLVSRWQEPAPARGRRLRLRYA